MRLEDPQETWEIFQKIAKKENLYTKMMKHILKRIFP
jgi:hypothetical protein